MPDSNSPDLLLLTKLKGKGHRALQRIKLIKSYMTRTSRKGRNRSAAHNLAISLYPTTYNKADEWQSRRGGGAFLASGRSIDGGGGGCTIRTDACLPPAASTTMSSRHARSHTAIRPCAAYITACHTALALTRLSMAGIPWFSMFLAPVRLR